MTETREAPTHDLVIRGGLVVGPDGERDVDICIDGGRISALNERGSAFSAERVIDAAGCLVIPGGVDPHVHYGMDFQGLLVTEGPEHSHAAIHGGTTSIIDFAVQEPPVTPLEAIAAKRAEHDGRMAVDWGLHVILTKDFSFDDVDQIGDVIASGIPTVKTMMTYGWMSDDGQRFGAMSEVARHGGMSVVHAEDDAIAKWLTAKYVREGKRDGAYISEVRGSLVEEAAIRRALFLAERAGSPLYVLHMAAEAGIDALAEARSRGLPAYGETLSAFLSFTQEDLWSDSPIEVDGVTYPRGALYNNYPTPKQPSDRDACWRAIADDRLQVVSTDHCLISVQDRFQKMGSTVDNMQAGQAAIELRVPLLYTLGVAAGRIDRTRWVRLISTNPAKLMGLWPSKGELTVGADADVVIFDPEATWTVHWEALHMSATYSCWDGFEMTGRVRDTLLRGQLLMDHGNYVGPRTAGRFVERKLLDEAIQPAPGTALTR